jgi:predicted transcriptional regulator
MAENNTKILAQWKKDKTLPEDASVEVLNQLFRKCLLKVSNIAEELQLPIPIQIPRVSAKEKEKK